MEQVVIHAWNTRTCTCTRKPGELPVHGDLAYTPAQMYEAAKAGVPISTQNISQLPADDFTDEESWIVPVEYRRGQDIADVWNAQRDARAKIVAAYNDKRKQLK